MGGPAPMIPRRGEESDPRAGARGGAGAKLAIPELSLGTETFQEKVIVALQSRGGSKESLLGIHALTEMAFGWFLTAVRIYFRGGRRSLVQCFDDVVAACVRATAEGLDLT